MIAQASKDENGKYRGGAAGDQTGVEVYVRAWYSRPWDLVIRAKDQNLGKRIAKAARRLTEAPQIGYDQGQRTTLYAECERIGWDLDRLYEIRACECDCSSMIAVVLGFCGVWISADVWTGSMESAVMGTGLFFALSDAAYTQSDKRLREGDILLNRAHHAAVNLDNGTDINVKVSYSAVVNVSEGNWLNVRTSPADLGEQNLLKVGGQLKRLLPHEVIAICEERGSWGRIMDIQGWVSLNYLIKGG